MFFVTNSPTQDLFGFTKITLEKCLYFLRGEKVLACDTETGGLSFIDDPITMIQITAGKTTYVIDAQTVNVKPLNEILGNPSVTVVMHNSSFDINFLRTVGILIATTHDTMLAEQVITLGEDVSYSLKDVLKRNLDVDLDKETRGSFIGHTGNFTKEQLLYGVNDTKYLIKLMKTQKAEIKRLDLVVVNALEQKAVLAFADCTWNGIYLDKDEWLGLAKASEAELLESRTALNQMLLKEFNPAIDLFGKPDFLWSSPKQVRELFAQIDSSVLYDGVGRPVLELIQHKHPIIRRYIQFKGTQKKVTSYGEKFFDNLHEDGRLHTRYRQMVSTGRTSSSGPNLQQLPRVGGFRECFKPEPNHVIVASDYNSQELVVIGQMAQEPLWLDTIRNGGDLHSVNAEELFGEEFTNETDPAQKKIKRDSVKALSFMLAYGGGARALSNRLEIPENDAQVLIDRYFDTFPKIKQFLDKAGENGVNAGMVKSCPPFNRRRVFPTWNGKSTNRTEKGRIDRQSRNYGIQSTSADMVKLAMIYVRQSIIDNKYDAKLLMNIHDELVTSCNESIAQDWAAELVFQMERAASVILEPGLLKASYKISKTWEK